MSNKTAEQQVKVVCANCNEEFYVKRSRYERGNVKYCSKNCMSLSMRKKIYKECDNCTEGIYVLPSQIKNNDHSFCSKKCSDIFLAKMKIKLVDTQCIGCEVTYSVKPSELKKTKYCNRECYESHKKKKSKYSSAIMINLNCNECQHPIVKSQQLVTQSRTKLFFCNNTCRSIYTKKNSKSWITKECIQCLREYRGTISKADSKFCSVKCRNDWESINKKGVNNPRFNSILFPCGYCKKDHYVAPHKLKDRDNFFCSIQCRQSWFAEVFTQTEEYSDFRRKVAVRLLEDGVIGNTKTECQEIVNDYLSDNGINYINDYNYNYYSIDNYLPDQDLLIEVMGSFWHCDPRFYQKVEYHMQKRSIKNDKAKRTYFINNHNKRILYLWEYDVLYDFEMCEKIINKFIKGNGELKEYHSFNYTLHENKLLELEDKIKPYFSYKIEELNLITDIKETKGKVSKKDETKWIKFSCEFCGDPKEQLIYNYNKSKHHFCSPKCGVKYYREIEKVDPKYDPSKHVTFNCEGCGENKTMYKRHYERNKPKFCSMKCKKEKYKSTDNLVEIK